MNHKTININDESKNDSYWELTKEKVQKHLSEMNPNLVILIDNSHLFNKLLNTGEFNIDEDILKAIEEFKDSIKQQQESNIININKLKRLPSNKELNKVEEKKHLSKVKEYACKIDNIEKMKQQQEKKIPISKGKDKTLSINSKEKTKNPSRTLVKALSSKFISTSNNSSQHSTVKQNNKSTINTSIGSVNNKDSLINEKNSDNTFTKDYNDQIILSKTQPIDIKKNDLSFIKSYSSSSLSLSDYSGSPHHNKNFVGSFNSDSRMKTYEVERSINPLKSPDIDFGNIQNEKKPITIIVPSLNNRRFNCYIDIHSSISSLKLFAWIEVFEVQNVKLKGNLVDYLFRAEHDDYFLDEKIPFNETPYFIYCSNRNIEIELYFVSKDEITEMESQIEEILNNKLISSKEASEFRREMQRIISHTMKSCYKRIIVSKNKSVDSFIKHLPSTFILHVWFPDDDKENKEKTFITCSVHTTGKQALVQIMEDFPYKFHGKSEIYEDYILKIRGLDEYIMEDVEIASIEYVRNALRKRRKVEVVVIEKESLDYNTQLFIDDYAKTKSSNLILDIDYCLNKEKISSNYYLSSWNIHQPLKVKIKSLSAIRFDPKIFKMPRKRNELIEIFIICSVQYAFNERIGPLVRTPKLIYYENSLEPFDFESLKENIWIELASLSSIPACAHIHFEVIAKLKDQETTIAYSNFNIFDSMKILKNKVHTIDVILGDPSSSESPSSDDILKLTFEIFDYNKPIAFPQVEFSPKSKTKEVNDQVYIPPNTLLKLEKLIESDALYIPTKEEREFLWEYREWVKKKPDSISLLMLCVPWSKPGVMKELYQLLDEWPPLYHPLNAIVLLGKNFTDPKIRAFAVKCLNSLTDEEISEVLLQLVQSLKHESSHDSALSRFLLLKALFNHTLIGHLFFWQLRACLQDSKYSERYLIISEIFLRYCSNFRLDLKRQTEIYNNLIQIAKDLKKVKDPSKRKPFLHEQLRNLNMPSSFQLPVSCKMVAKSFNIEKCKNLDSKTLPLWLVCENYDPLGDEHLVIMKVGDDLRQDQLTLQMIRIMDKLWLKEGLDLKMSPYHVIETGYQCGMVEVVPNASTQASIQKEHGMMAVFSYKPLSEWLKKYNPNESDHKSAIRDFIRSCAGYCVATYVLGIGDRHNDNIMCTKSGHLFHIDFGKFLGNTEKFVGISRDRVPFVYTQEFAYVMGGYGSSDYKIFVELCKKAYNIVRKHSNLIISLFSMMLQTGIPELRKEDDLKYLRDSLSLNLTDEEAGKKFENLIEIALNSFSTQFNFAVHILANPDKN